MRVGFDNSVPKRVQDHLFHVVDLLVRNGHFQKDLRVIHLQAVKVEFSMVADESWMPYLMEKDDYIAVEKMLYSNGDSCWLKIHLYNV